MTDHETKTVSSNGVEVIPGKVATSQFIKDSIAENGKNFKFDGTLEELEALTEAHMESWVPGIGSVDGDVRIVKLPTEGFYTDIVEVTPENAKKISYFFEPRREGEDPVPQLLMASGLYPKAAEVGIVIYRADVLERDSDRSSDAEWEIVAILADPCEDVPMHPTTMARNAAHAKGGTYREYSAEEWLRATLFWQNHVKLSGSDAP